MKRLYFLHVLLAILLVFGQETIYAQGGGRSGSSGFQTNIKRTPGPSKTFNPGGRASISVTPLDGSTTPEDLVEKILGPGITYSNVTFVGTDGTGTSSAGLFSGGNQAGMDIDDGIMLSSGYIQNAIGPNTSDKISKNLGLSGDSDLDALIPGYTTYDATILEFDFEVPGDELNIQFVFASEEYNEYVGSEYNDVFGFYVDGTNIAFVPTSNDPVTINTINNSSNSGYYVDNERPNDSYDFEADGFTTNLIGNISITPNVTHHMKIAIADAGDHIYDSWVFIQEGSFSIPIDVDLGPDQTICEGESVTLDAGNPGFNYLWSPGGETTQTITVSPATTTTYSVMVYLGGSSGTDDVTINVVPPPTADAGPDADVCQGHSYTIPSGDASATNYSSLLWTHNGAGSLSDETTLTPTYTPTSSETGTVTLTLTAYGNGSCPDAQDDMDILITPALQLSGEITPVTCAGSNDGAIDLTVSGGTTPYTYNWNNGATTQDLSGLAGGTYSVTVTDANGCTGVGIYNVPESSAMLTLSADITPVTCAGDQDGAIDLTVAGGTAPYTYLWSNGETTRDISGLAGGDYTVTVTDTYGCTANGTYNGPE